MVIPELLGQELSIVMMSIAMNTGASAIRMRSMEILRDMVISELGATFEQEKISVGKESVADIFKKKRKYPGQIKKKTKEGKTKGSYFLFNLP